MEIKFKNPEHKQFYHDMLEQCGRDDVYHRALFYTIGISADSRRNVKSLFDFEKRLIQFTGLNGPWQTSCSYRVCQLAFNLFNGFVDKKNPVNTTPYEIFGGTNARYMLEAVKVRYPEYFRDVPYIPPAGAEYLGLAYDFQEQLTNTMGGNANKTRNNQWIEFAKKAAAQYKGGYAECASDIINALAEVDRKYNSGIASHLYNSVHDTPLTGPEIRNAGEYIHMGGKYTDALHIARRGGFKPEKYETTKARLKKNREQGPGGR